MVSTPPPASPPRPCPAGVLTEGGPRSQGRKHLAGSAEPSRVARPKAVASRRSEPTMSFLPRHASDACSRREFLWQSGLGFGTVALATLLRAEGLLAADGAAAPGGADL